MGWDAYAKFDDRPDKEQILSRFRENTDFLKKNGCTVDAYLSYGGLGVSTCGKMLEEAVNSNISEYGYLSVYGREWSPEEVKKISQLASWDFEVEDKDEEWAKHSAKAFLEVCAEFDLEIYFSW